jgi:hypothetical protein
MANRSATPEKLRLQGPPRRLRAVSSAMRQIGEYQLRLPDVLSKSGAPAMVSAHVLRQREDAGQLRVRLPESTPPGEYTAQLETDSGTYPVALVVEPQVRLRSLATRSVFEGKPGETAEIMLTVSNRGNIAVAVPEAITIGIYDDDGLEDAFASTYRQDTDDPLKLLGHWILKVREGYGGLLKCTVAAAGEIAPSEERTLTVRTKLPEKLKPGHSYHGVLEIGPLAQSISVSVLKTGRGDRK